MSEFEGFETDEPLPPAPTPLPESERTPEYEQALRDSLGYAKSETRTQAERQAVADKIMAKTKGQVEWVQGVWRRQADLQARPRSIDARETPKPFRPDPK